MSSIKLSPKHGVNPTLTRCFWCGKDVGVALMGRLKGDVEAPRHIVVDYEFCAECKSLMSEGITFMEASDKPNYPDQPPMQHNVYPTGRYAIVTNEAVRRLVDDELYNSIVASGNKTFIDIETARMVGLFDTEGENTND